MPSFQLYEDLGFGQAGMPILQGFCGLRREEVAGPARQEVASTLTTGGHPNNKNNNEH